MRKIIIILICFCLNGYICTDVTPMEYRNGSPFLRNDANTKFAVYPIQSDDAKNALFALLNATDQQPAWDVVQFFVRYFQDKCYLANRETHLQKDTILKGMKLAIKHAQNGLIGVEVYCPYGIDGVGNSWATIFTIKDKRIFDVDVSVIYASYYDIDHYSIRSSYPSMPVGFFRPLSQLTSITMLDIFCSSPSETKHLAKLQKLEYLVIYCDAVPESLPKVIALLPSLEILRIQITRSDDDKQNNQNVLNELYATIQSHPKLCHVELFGKDFVRSSKINGYEYKRIFPDDVKYGAYSNAYRHLFYKGNDMNWFSSDNWSRGYRALYKESLNPQVFEKTQDINSLDRKVIDELIQPEYREAAWTMLNCVVNELVAIPCKRNKLNPQEMRDKIIADINIRVVDRSNDTKQIWLDSEAGLGEGDDEGEGSETLLFTLRDGKVINFDLRTSYYIGDLSSHIITLRIGNAEFLETLSKLTTIETLKLDFDEVNDEEALKLLRNLTNVKNFEISVQVLPETLPDALQEMKLLESLHITCCERRESYLDNILYVLPFCPNFKSLESNISPLKGDAFSQLHALTHLKLPVTNDKALKNIGCIPNLIDLTLLSTKDLGEWYLGYTNKGLAALEPLKKLRSISFDDNPALSLTYLPALPELEVVKMEKMTLCADDIIHLGNCPKLRRLECTGVLTPGDEKYLDKLSELRSLILMETSGQFKTSSNMTAFPSLPNLEYVRVSCDSITDEGLIRILQSPHLKEVDIMGNAITKQGRDDAYQKFPNIELYIRGNLLENWRF